MSSATAGAPAATGEVRRRVPRYPVAVPVDVTLLRAGVADSIPGRLLDIGEGGIALALAGELSPGDYISVEFRLPNLSMRLQAKAVVRNQAQLRYGLEFLALSAEAQAMIRYWVAQSEAGKADEPPVDGTQPLSRVETKRLDLGGSTRRRRSGLRTRLWRAARLALPVLVVVSVLGGWRWQRGWHELEARIPPKQSLAARSADGPALISPDVMQKLLTHKVDPVYPEGARLANLQGIVLLDTIVGPDGGVEDVRPVSGPEGLARAAVEAVKWWRFQPYRMNGKAIAVETTVAVEFRPES